MAVSILFFCMALGTGPSLRNLRQTSAARTTDDGRTGGSVAHPLLPPSAIRTANFEAEFLFGFSAERCVDDHRRQSLLFLKCCSGGVCEGEAPLGISVTRALPPCLAPHFFSSVKFFDRKFVRRKNFPDDNFSAEMFSAENFSAEIFSVEIFSAGNFAIEKIFGQKFFRPNFFRPSIRSSVRRPSVRRAQKSIR